MSVAVMTNEQIDRCEHVFSEPGFGAMSTERGNLPLEALSVRAAIRGLFAKTTLQQIFVNQHDQPLEATYIFPLPDRGAVVGFRMYAGERVIDGVLKERGQARYDYSVAISQGKIASIVEEERPDTFTMRVGNIAPGERATIELELVVPLLFAAGEATFRFPLVVAQRYIPGSPRDGSSVGSGTSPDTDAVPDASRITPPVLLPGFKSPVRLSIEVSLDRQTLIDVDSLSSSLHAVTSVSNENHTIVGVQPGARIDRDFILRFRVATDRVRSSLYVVPDAQGQSSTFLLNLIPPSEAADKRRPRDLVFVLDRSGSMGGWKMAAARRAVGRMIDTLTADDSFQVIAFDTSIETPENLGTSLISATNRNRFQTIEWLATCDARGGTEMAQPMYHALKLLADGNSGRDRYVVLVTDGQVGNEDQIVRGVHVRMKSTHVFTVGIDRAVNAGFLNRLAEISGGRCELVESEDRLDEVMERLHQMIDTPVLNDVHVTFSGASLVPKSITPDRPASLFAAAPLTIAGRLTGKGAVTAHVHGTTPGNVLFEESVDGQLIDEPSLAAVWARARLRSLEDDYAANHGDRRAIERQIVEISLKFKVLCRFTSFVAVDEESHVDGELLQVIQSVESISGWGREADRVTACHCIVDTPLVTWERGMEMQALAWKAYPRMKSPRNPPLPTFFADDLDELPAMEAMAEAPSSDEGMVMEAMESEVSPERSSLGGKLKRREADSAKPMLRMVSPERARGLHLSPADNVFWLGLVLAELLLGKPLDTGDLDTWDVSKLPATLDAYSVLQRALAPDPRDRLATALEFLQALVRLAQQLGLKAANPAADPMTRLARSFGPYVINNYIATLDGGVEIWLGTRGDQPRVLRVLDDYDSRDELITDAFFEEASLDAPSVMKLVEFGFEEDRAYKAYEGQCQGALSRSQTVEQAFSAVVDIATGLAPAHYANVVVEGVGLQDVVVVDGVAHFAGLGAASTAIEASMSVPTEITRWRSSSDAFWK